MEDVERDFGIPKTPVPMNIPSWGIPVPATLVKDFTGYRPLKPSALLWLRSIYHPATYLTYSLGLQAIIVIALLANAYESASSKLEGLTTA
ncbi:hypothetical protein AFLA_000452 [Aspergillus flavus NRRL3357]|nr:hypothetical protein AFLA_000452 [Aspergillus flavus NRRL3357]